MYINKVVIPNIKPKPSEETEYDKRCVWVKDKSGKWRFSRINMNEIWALYIGHEDMEVEVLENEGMRDSENSEQKPKTETRTVAFEIYVQKPLTRAKCIDSAERTAYCLKDDWAVASFNASLARKHRLDPEDKEVKQHDEFINQVKTWLDDLGIR